MDPALAQVVRHAAWWFFVGGCLGLIGGCWPPYRQWSAPLEEGLRVIAAHPTGWRLIHTGFLTGIWMLAVGALILAYALRGAPGGTAALVAACLVSAGAVAWSLNIAYRLSATVWAANRLVQSGAVPESYRAWKTLAGYLFAAFSVLSYASVAATGTVVLQSGLASRSVGWLMIAWGATLGFVVGSNVPLIAYIPYIILGGLVLRG